MINNFYDISKTIVNNLRETGNISNISFVEKIGNYYYYTITVPDSLSVVSGDWINITDSADFNSDNLEITNVNNNIFTIKRLDNPEITDLGTWQANKPYLMINKLLKASQELTLKGNSIIYKNQKFPLIHIVLNILENRNADQRNISIINNVTILFVTNSKHNASTEWRRENIFETILIPLYESFLSELKRNKYISKAPKLIPHDYIEDYDFGSDVTDNKRYGNNTNVYNEITEAIIVRFNQIKIYNISPC